LGDLEKVMDYVEEQLTQLLATIHAGRKVQLLILNQRYAWRDAGPCRMEVLIGSDIMPWDAK
jgi:CO dehydrogenase/acetyl-CoA synthase alpha subunit